MKFKLQPLEKFSNENFCASKYVPVFGINTEFQKHSFFPLKMSEDFSVFISNP